MAKVSVVIPTWDGAHILPAALDGLAAQELPDGVELETIVVDNGSRDGTAALIAERYPAVRVVSLPVNRGFAGGVNAGIRAASGELVALLNNDAVPEPPWLARLIAGLGEEAGVGACTSKIVQAGRSGPVQFDTTGDYYTIFGRAHARGRDEIDVGQYDTPGEVFGATGAATLYRRALFDRVGLFDEEFFAYYEDVDLSLRARLAGFRTRYEPAAVVRHQMGATSGGAISDFSRYHTVKNQWYTFCKNLPGPLLAAYLPGFVAYQAAFFGTSFVTGLQRAHARSLLRAARMAPAVWRQRREIQRGRVLTSRELNAWLIKSFEPGAGRKLRRLVTTRAARRAVPVSGDPGGSVCALNG